jgi:nucleoside-diphosphate-sugar epimerase
MRALVTGGGGFLGAAVVRQLRARGDDVRSFARGDYPALRALGVDVVRGDLDDAAAVSRACAGVDVVFHVAAKAGIWGRADDYDRANVRGTEHILAACRRNDLRTLVFTSSPSVVFGGAPIEGGDESLAYPKRYLAHYPRTKAVAEQLVLAANDLAGLRTVALRPHLIWGPGDNHLVPRIIARARAGQLRRVGDGRAIVDSVYVENAAEAHLLAADRLRADAGADANHPAGKAYFITNEEPVAIGDLLDRILAAADLPPVRRAIPAPVAYAAGLVAETIFGALRVEREPRMTRFLAKQLSTAHWFDGRAARRDLGYVPRVSIDEGMKHLAVWLRSAHTERRASVVR